MLDEDDADPDAAIVEGRNRRLEDRFSSNQSKYDVDGKAFRSRSRRTVRRKGIDLDNNRFILQGEVEQIAMMKPKAPSPHEEGLLEYLEDIIGSNNYVEPIEAASRVGEACEARTEKLNRLKVAGRSASRAARTRPRPLSRRRTRCGGSATCCIKF